jgi:hypothetical protein
LNHTQRSLIPNSPAGCFRRSEASENWTAKAAQWTDHGGDGGVPYDEIIYLRLTKETYADKDRQEALIRESSLDWIIVRPASFTNGPQRGNLRAVTDLKNVTIRSISRADAAAFVLEQLRSDRYLRKTPLVGY